VEHGISHLLMIDPFLSRLGKPTHGLPFLSELLYDVLNSFIRVQKRQTKQCMPLKLTVVLQVIPMLVPVHNLTHVKNESPQCQLLTVPSGPSSGKCLTGPRSSSDSSDSNVDFCNHVSSCRYLFETLCASKVAKRTQGLISM
jgi:hypothetical protein